MPPLEPQFAFVEQRSETGVDVAVISGEIHVSTADRFRAALEAIIERSDGWLVLDLTAVEFIDSTGLSVLLSGLRQLGQRGGRMALACTNPTVLRLFEITSLDTTFDIFADRPAAIAHVTAG